MTEKIYALHEAVNAYEQEGTYIRHIWFSKPSMFDVASALGFTFPCSNDEATLNITKLWQGHEVRFDAYGSHWQIREHNEGKIE